MNPTASFDGLLCCPASLLEYDWIVVNTSAGKDSLATLSTVTQEARLYSCLNGVIAIHADLGRVEWAGTRELAERQSRAHGVPFVAVRRNQNDLLDQVEARGKWPSSGQRYCTSDHKRAPIQKYFTQLAAETRAARKSAGSGDRSPVRILNCMGMRADESPARAKKAAFQPGAYGTNGRRIIDDYLPIHAWTERDVWGWIEQAGLRPLVHPAYALGMPRLSCCFCIFAGRDALIIAGHHNPDLLREYVRVERKIGHTFRQNLPVADIAAAVAAGEVPQRACGWKM